MRKESSELILYNKLKQKKIRNKQLRAANKKRHYKLLAKIDKIRNREHYETVSLREQITYSVYRHRQYNEARKTINIDQDIGIEEQGRIISFLDYAESIIDFNSKELLFDLSKCSRVWPSAITLFCSLMQWVELTSSTKHRPRIASGRAEDVSVDDYLFHCGFYDYVNVSRPEEPSGKNHDKYSDVEVVKIERETKKANIEKREDQVINLLGAYSALTKTELELFSDVVLIEALNNVTEHGIYHKDYGWWLLAQYHPHTK